MADFETRKISQLPPAGIAVREDKLEVSRTGATWSVTAGQMADLADMSAYLPLDGGTLTGDLTVDGTITGTTVALAGLLTGTTAAFSGEITAATPATADNDTTVATTAFVKAQNYVTGTYLPLAGGTLAGPGNLIISGTLTGAAAAFSGNVTFPTQTAGTNNTTGATTAFVNTAVASVIGGATPAGPAGGDLAGTYPNPSIKASVVLTGTPTVPGYLALGGGTLTGALTVGGTITGTTATMSAAIPAASADTTVATTAWIKANVLPPGAIMDFAGTAAPSGWLLCQGQSVTVAAYPNLHTVIGYAYGGSGENFNVPDLGGRVTAGKETAAVRLTAGGAGIDGSVLGAAGGAQTHVLTTGQLAAHTHPELGADNTRSIGTLYGTIQAGATINMYYASDTGSAGGGAAHQNTQPTIILNKIIKT